MVAGEAEAGKGEDLVKRGTREETYRRDGPAWSQSSG